MNDKNVLLVSDVEHATILNALRFWQVAGRPVFPEHFDAGDAPVAEDKLDGFIERLSTDVTLSILLTVERGIVTNAFVPGGAECLGINVFDMDTDGVDEDSLEELSLPFLGIQSGTAYAVARNIDAPELLGLLADKWEAEALTRPADGALEDDLQQDMFNAGDLPPSCTDESEDEPEHEHADA